MSLDLAALTQRLEELVRMQYEHNFLLVACYLDDSDVATVKPRLSPSTIRGAVGAFGKLVVRRRAEMLALGPGIRRGEFNGIAYDFMPVDYVEGLV